MNMIRAMIWKEIHSFLHDWKIVVPVTLFAIGFPCLILFTQSFATPGLGLIASCATTTVVVPYTLTLKSFMYERGENALTSMLASPLSVLEFFLGKSLAIFLFGYPFVLAAAVVAVCGMGAKTGGFPSISDFIMALLATPVCGLAIIELVGALILLLGNFDLVRFIAFVPAVIMVDVARSVPGALADYRVALAIALVGLAVVVAIAVLFSKVSRARLAK